MRKLSQILFSLFCITTYSQTITVDNTTNTPADLVNLLLGNSCVSVSNISVSSTQSVAYFNQNGSTFPINEGIIIRNGQAVFSQGAYTGTNLSSSVTASGDAYLQNLSNNNGGTRPIVDAEYLQFDFIPLSNSFSFDFLFASNEYGFYQCEFSDVFAFVLTNLSTGVSTNLAVIPGTNTPVSVATIRNSIYNDPASPNNSCASSNPGFFGTYNVGNPTSALNMRGQTVVMNAASAVIPNTPYRIRLVIGDYDNSGFDSAVFIAAGSFTTTLDLGSDRVICTGDTFQLNTNLDNTFTYTWYENGNPIPGATNSTYTVTHAGTYSVEAVRGTCTITDAIVFTDLAVTNPSDLSTCNTGAVSYNFNLSTNNESALGIDTAIYDVFYYLSPADIAANNPIPNGNLPSFGSPGGQTIYIKIFNTVTGHFCDAIYSFDLIVTNAVVATQPNPISVCEGQGNTIYTFTNTTTNEVLNGQSASNYTVTYYNSVGDATSGTNSITSVSIPNGTTTITVGIRMQDNSNPSCFDVTTVTISVNPLPVVSTIADVVECDNYTLPPIANGTYHDAPNGGGNQLNPGDIINVGGTYYIFAGPDANGCTNQSSFTASFINEYIPSLDNCGSFTVPLPPYNIGGFYTAAGGPTGSGTLILPGTTYTNATQSTITQDIYYYAEMNGSLCVDQLFTINIHPIPLVDNPADVTTCDSYVLPSLTNGTYNTASDGSGATLNAGDVISVTGPNFPGTYFVFNSLAHTTSHGLPGSCTDFRDIVINLVDTSVFTAVSRCGVYTLPAVAFGGYYTAPNGGGTQITDLNITSSQTVYYFTNTTTLPNCTTNLNYNITIHPLPPVDTIASGVHCGEFVLPVLTNGTYYTLSGGPTVIGQQQLNAGDTIDLTGTHLNPGTYYIYNGPDANTCDKESNFTITLNPFPPADNVFSRTECSPYTIATPVNGIIYTAAGGPGGGGTLVSPTDVFNTTQTFHLYNIDPTTACSIDKPFTVTYNGLNLPDYQGIRDKCDTENYTLPVLTHVPPTPFNYSIGYFYSPNGINPVPPGTVFNTPNTQTTIYVFAKNGDRIICTQEESFVIRVSETPVLPNYPTGKEYCGSYTLPAFPAVNYTINYYSQPGGMGLISPSNYTYSTPGIYTVYVYATATNNVNCNDETQFTFTVHPLLPIDFPDGIICVDPTTNQTVRPYTINTGLNPTLYTVNWYLNGTLMGTGPSYTATQIGTYDVKFTKLTPDIGADCNYKDTQVVITKSSTALATYTLTGAFEGQIDIIVNITGGSGEYLFQLDSGPFQSSNVFYNVASGEHLITIKDTKADCGDITLKADVLRYPHFFTPNNDNYNDRWNISDLKNQPDAIINIYDRFGKFLKQISPAGEGWDGTFNGVPLPSTDYWFQVFYTLNNEPKEFRAHFSMKR